MELYGRIPVRNGSQSGHQPEWSPTGAETGLEDSMWQLPVRSTESYPDRPGVPDCVYYMRTGFCAYGSRCRYNHPRDRAAVEAAVRASGDYPERPGEPACQFYLKTGTCKFGASCKFHHPKNGGGALVSHVALNIYGYPLRPGEKECSYYLKTGQCKFGITCKFHHPQPAGTSVPSSAPQFYQPVQSPSVPIPDPYIGASNSLRMARSPLLPGSYVQGAYGPVLISPGMVPISGWSHYSASVSPVLSPGAQPPVGTSLYGLTQLPSTTPSFAGPYPSLLPSPGPSSSSQKDLTFPDRPGEPECQYFLKTGDCKYGSACRYHHPRERAMLRTTCALSPMGLPLRQGVPPCSFYLQNGHCKFGSSCRFDHPIQITTMRYNPSASSLVDMPVAPYPVGSLLATLAPASSSPDLNRIPSSGASLTELPPSGQTSVPLNSSRITRQGSDARRSN